jgi:2'-5' RNA ligase
MPRLFTAFTIPDMHEDWLSGLELELPGARWISPDDYHVTIRFFGDVDRHVEDDLIAGLASVRLRAFSARIVGLGSFGGNRPRALVAELAPEPALDEVRRAHERIAQSAGLEPERRKFAPHVTVARLKGTRPETIARFIQSFSKPVLPPLLVSEIVLFSSRPGGGGPYVAEETFSLLP